MPLLNHPTRDNKSSPTAAVTHIKNINNNLINLEYYWGKQQKIGLFVDKGKKSILLSFLKNSSNTLSLHIVRDDKSTIRLVLLLLSPLLDDKTAITKAKQYLDWSSPLQVQFARLGEFILWLSNQKVWIRLRCIRLLEIPGATISKSDGLKQYFCPHLFCVRRAAERIVKASSQTSLTLNLPSNKW